MPPDPDCDPENSSGPASRRIAGTPAKRQLSIPDAGPRKLFANVPVNQRGPPAKPAVAQRYSTLPVLRAASSTADHAEAREIDPLPAKIPDLPDHGLILDENGEDSDFQKRLAAMDPRPIAPEPESDDDPDLTWNTTIEASFTAPFDDEAPTYSEVLADLGYD